MSIERELVEKTLLECTAGNSNKFYEIKITKVIEKYDQGTETRTNIMYYVETRWGKRTEGYQDKGGQESTRHPGFHNLNNAKNDVSDVIQSKLNKGYVTVKNRKDLESRNFDLERFSMLDL